MSSIHSQHGLMIGTEPGVEELFRRNDFVKINGLYGTPALFLDGRQATMGGWACRCKPTNVATLTGTGDSPDLDVIGPYLADKAVLMKAAKFYQMNPAPNEVGLTTEDWKLRLIAWPNQTSDYCVGKVSSTGPGDGYLMYFSGTSLWSAWIKTNGLASRSHGATPAWPLGTLADVQMFFDYSDATNALRIFVNGVDGGAGFGWGLGSLANDGPFQIGNGSQLSDNPFGGGIVAVTLHKKAGWFPGGASNTTVWEEHARQEHARLIGSLAAHNPGASIVPVTL